MRYVEFMTVPIAKCQRRKIALRTGLLRRVGVNVVFRDAFFLFFVVVKTAFLLMLSFI
jgi:hypothetical protein